jgi:membrane dipeptidase
MDGHNQIMIELSLRNDRGHQDVFSSYYAPLIRKGGVNALFMVVGSDDPSLSNLNDAVTYGTFSLIDVLREEEAVSGDFQICLTAADIEEAVALGKIGVVMKLEGSRPIEGPPDRNSLCLLRSLYRLGLRGICIVGAGRNKSATGVGAIETNSRLTTFGVELVKEMNRLGMVIDVAHMTDRCFYDLLEITSDPIHDSHTNTQKHCDIARNLSDRRIRAMAENGGVIGVMFQTAMIKKRAYETGERVTIDDLVRHIDHIAGLIGTNYIAFGSDIDEFELVENIHRAWSPVPGYIENLYYGVPKTKITVQGLEGVEKYPLLTDALLRRGYSDEDVRKIMGANLLKLVHRVLK